MTRRIPKSEVAKTYYFDFHDGKTIERDEVGSACSSPELAIEEAISALTDIVRERPPCAGDNRHLSFDITGDTHEPLFNVEIRFTVKRLD